MKYIISILLLVLPLLTEAQSMPEYIKSTANNIQFLDSITVDSIIYYRYKTDYCSITASKYAAVMIPRNDWFADSLSEAYNRNLQKTLSGWLDKNVLIQMEEKKGITKYFIFTLL